MCLVYSEGRVQDAAYFEVLGRNEEQHFWYRSRDQLLVWALSRHFPAARGVLEIGCRAGHVLAAFRRAFPDQMLVGSEIESESVAAARARFPHLPLVRADARHLPFAAAFDVIGLFDVLEHIDEDERVLLELFTATRPGGGIVLTVPQHPRLWSIVDIHSGHRRRYTRSEVTHKLRQTGFEIVRATSFVSLLLPLAWLSRMRQNSAGLDLDSELAVPRLLNAGLGAIMSAERWLIEQGVSFRMGLSLLVVARR
jgi:SAM-dependent methyltransferase